MKFKEELKILDNQLYLWLGDYLSILSINQLEVISPKSILNKLKIIIKEIIKDFLLIFTMSNCNLKNKDIAFVESINNIEALTNLLRLFLYIVLCK